MIFSFITDKFLLFRSHSLSTVKKLKDKQDFKGFKPFIWSGDLVYDIVKNDFALLDFTPIGDGRSFRKTILTFSEI